MNPRKEPVISYITNPLVSVLVHCFNQEENIEDCLNSIANQTYSNIEIVFSDNSSTDGSWQKALTFQRKHPEMITLFRNRKDFGQNESIKNCGHGAHGKYVINMQMTDRMETTFVEKCVNVLENNLTAGFVMAHRKITDRDGNQIPEAPFYDKSCLVPGHLYANTFMSEDKGYSKSQIMYNRRRVGETHMKRAFFDPLYWNHILDFNISLDYPVAYICEELITHRVNRIENLNPVPQDMLDIFSSYLLKHQFAAVAEVHKIGNVVSCLPQSIKDIAVLSLSHCVTSLVRGDEKTAKRYYFLSQAIAADATDTKTLAQIASYWQAEKKQKDQILRSLQKKDTLNLRKTSLHPPQGSTILTHKEINSSHDS